MVPTTQSLQDPITDLPVEAGQMPAPRERERPAAAEVREVRLAGSVRSTSAQLAGSSSNCCLQSESLLILACPCLQ